ncbi:MAG: DMT family transporter [Gammaproteobacteria bacterium]|nr:DMT family transporter [Gammaproteobacteria bacterium]
MIKAEFKAVVLSRVIFSYLAVVVIWSTTPLAIKWSSEQAGFVFAVLSRMLIGTVLALLTLAVLNKNLDLSRQAVKVYLAAAVSIYASMQLVYWGALYIPSGLIAVLFGLAPLITSLLAEKFLDETKHRHYQWLAMLLSIVGLMVIFYQAVFSALLSIKGVIIILLAVMLHSASAVMVKAINPGLSAVTVTAGALLVALPLFTITWLANGATVPEQISLKAMLSIVYLAAMGSVVGFMLYYFLLQNLSTSAVALITLITPVTALMLGLLFNHETITIPMACGTFFVLMGLVIYQWGDKLLSQWVR